MFINYQILELKKRYPLRISRGEISGSSNLFLSIDENGVNGIGEAAPGSNSAAQTAQLCQQQLETFLQTHNLDNSSPFDAWYAARSSGVEPCAYAALDIAWWDFLAKRCAQPLYQLLGLPRRSVPTSVTIGILPAEIIRERIAEILARTGAKYLKVKLGSTEGIEADQAMFSAVCEATAKQGVGIRVDANGGWSLAQARLMMHWLAERGVEYIEQPLVQGSEDQLPELYRNRALPIFVDESCRFSTDIPAFAASVDGVNLKLMKCGGITEALRIVATARAHGLKTMIGCMGESTIAISAAAALGALFDYIDLDSNLNLINDPATGAQLNNGVVLPTQEPGHGASINC